LFYLLYNVKTPHTKMDEEMIEVAVPRKLRGLIEVEDKVSSDLPVKWIALLSTFVQVRAIFIRISDAHWQAWPHRGALKSWTGAADPNRAHGSSTPPAHRSGLGFGHQE
jgi:hypothetical protein